MSKPVSPRPLRKAAAICAYSQDDPPLRNPITGRWRNKETISPSFNANPAIPAPDIRQKAGSYVEGLTRPIIGGIDAGEVLTVQWPKELHALMAFLQREALVERLMAEIKSDREHPLRPP